MPLKSWYKNGLEVFARFRTPLDAIWNEVKRVESACLAAASLGYLSFQMESGRSAACAVTSIEVEGTATVLIWLKVASTIPA